MMDRRLLARIKKVSRKDLAHEAGLSYSYLSNIINDFYNLSDSAKSKIEEALDRMERRKEKKVETV